MILTMPSLNTGRYHALDSMRAAMMLMGIYLHIVVGYSGNGNWPYIDANPTHVLDFTLGLIHSFRMPAFFVMAGFFGSLLWNGRGPAGFIRNRVSRVLVPFVVFWSVIYPLNSFIVMSMKSGPAAWWPFVASGRILGYLHPMHLWFLYYLMMLYAIGAVTAWAVPSSWMGRIHGTYRWVLEKSWAPAAWALLSLGPLTVMHGNLKDCDGFKPELPILAAYIPPFLFGWLLYHHRDMLERFLKWTRVYSVLVTPAFLVYGLVSGTKYPLIRAMGNVLCCWLLIFVCIGAFLRHCSKPSGVWRYLSDGSYWMFIVHLPVVVLLQVAMKNVPLPALAKIPIVLALATVILVASYDLLVRATAIGALLNGRRYERGLPLVGTTAAAGVSV